MTTSANPLKFFTSNEFLLNPGATAFLLMPFLDTPILPSINLGNTLIPYFSIAQQLFTLSDPASADVFIYPQFWIHGQRPLLLQKFCQLANKYGKPVLVFDYGDHYEPIPYPNVIALRTSLYASTRLPHEYPIPPLFRDLLENYNQGQLTLRNYSDKPTIGFCGDAIYTDRPAAAGIINYLKWQHQRLRYAIIANVDLDCNLRKVGIALTQKVGSRIRAQSIIPLRKSKRVHANFIIRAGCMNGARLTGTSEDNEHYLRSHYEYYKNQLESDYILCPRGTGNFSLRFYETLAMGRIPVFINTDCMLPFEKEIQWKQHCVWVEEKDIASLEDKILKFHKKLSPTQFTQLQKANRKIYEEYIKPERFFAKIGTILGACAATNAT